MLFQYSMPYDIIIVSFLFLILLMCCSKLIKLIRDINSRTNVLIDNAPLPEDRSTTILLTGYTFKNPIFYYPYMISVSNNTDEVVNDIDLFGAEEYVNSDKFDRKTDVLEIKEGVSIAAVSSTGLSYHSCLDHIYKHDKPTIGYITSICKSGSTSQIIQFLTVKRGEEKVREIVPMIDPYQQRNDILSRHVKPFVIDSKTKITIDRVLPKTEIHYYFYPISDEFILKLISIEEKILSNPIVKIFVKIRNRFKKPYYSKFLKRTI